MDPILIDVAREVVRICTASGVPCCVIGGVALSAHKYERATTDVDILSDSRLLGVARNALLESTDSSFRFQFLEGGGEAMSLMALPTGNGRSVRVDLLGAPEFGGFPQEVSFMSDWKFPVIRLDQLIRLKLMACRAREETRDHVDIASLIQYNHLDRGYFRRIGFKDALVIAFEEIWDKYEKPRLERLLSGKDYIQKKFDAFDETSDYNFLGQIQDYADANGIDESFAEKLDHPYANRFMELIHHYRAKKKGNRVPIAQNIVRDLH